MTLDLEFKFFILWLEELYSKHLSMFPKFPWTTGGLGSLINGPRIVWRL